MPASPVRTRLRALLRRSRSTLDRVGKFELWCGSKMVEHYIHRVRKTIDTDRPPLIDTVRGIGYILEEQRP